MNRTVGLTKMRMILRLNLTFVLGLTSSLGWVEA